MFVLIRLIQLLLGLWGTRIISLTTFWCSSKNDDSDLNLNLIPPDIKDLLAQLRMEKEPTLGLTTTVDILVSLSGGPAIQVAQEDLDPELHMTGEDFGRGNLFSPMSGTVLDEDDDNVDWDLLDY